MGLSRVALCAGQSAATGARVDTATYGSGVATCMASESESTSLGTCDLFVQTIAQASWKGDLLRASACAHSFLWALWCLLLPVSIVADCRLINISRQSPCASTSGCLRYVGLQLKILKFEKQGYVVGEIYRITFVVERLYDCFQFKSRVFLSNELLKLSLCIIVV